MVLAFIPISEGASLQIKLPVKTSSLQETSRTIIKPYISEFVRKTLEKQLSKQKLIDVFAKLCHASASDDVFDSLINYMVAVYENSLFDEDSRSRFANIASGAEPSPEESSYWLDELSLAALYDSDHILTSDIIASHIIVALFDRILDASPVLVPELAAALDSKPLFPLLTNTSAHDAVLEGVLDALVPPDPFLKHSRDGHLALALEGPPDESPLASGADGRSGDRDGLADGAGGDGLGGGGRGKASRGGGGGGGGAGDDGSFADGAGPGSGAGDAAALTATAEAEEAYASLDADDLMARFTMRDLNVWLKRNHGRTERNKRAVADAIVALRPQRRRGA